MDDKAKDLNDFALFFVIRRTVGWIPQWIESKKDKISKIETMLALYGKIVRMFPNCGVT